ncbi:mechanosensitive ion channel family protein [Bartonella sp. B41]
MDYSLKKNTYILLLFLGIITVFSFCGWGRVVSQDVITGQSINTHSIDKILWRQQSIVKALQRETEDLKKDFKRESENERALAKFKLRAEDISKRVLEAAFVLRAPMNDINLLIDQFRTLPNNQKSFENQNDSLSVLKEKKDKINSTVRQFEEVFLATNKIEELVVSQSRKLLKSKLMHRFDFSVQIAKHIAEKTKEASSDFIGLFNSWWNFVFYLKPFQLFFSFFIPLLAFFIFSYFSRRALVYAHRGVVKYDEGISYFRRLFVAFISILLPSLAFVFCIYLVFFWFHIFGLDMGKLTTVFHTVGYQISLVFLINRLVVVLLSSNALHMRPLNFNIAPYVAQQLIILLTFLGVILAFDAILDSVYEVILAPLSLTIAKNFIAVLLVAMLLFMISFVPLRFRYGRFSSSEERSLFWPLYIRIPLILSGLLLILIDFFGYIGLACFFMQQIVIDSAFFVLMYLGIQSAQVIGLKGQFKRMRVGYFLMKWLHLEERTMDWLGIVVSIFLNLVVFVFCAIPMVMQFGFSFSELSTMLWQLITGFQIGNVSVSLISIVAGIVVFFVCLFLIHRFIDWLDDMVLTREEFDSGVRNSIKTVINYGGVVVSTLVGLSIAGLDLRNFALIAGGLSLGIGFGLQNIVQNFVSGLIILIGRPFKLGDYVEAGSVSGIVKRIRVRATELETFQRKTVIIPNSSLINNNVSNWTRRSKMGQIDIPITVSPNIAPESVVEILLEIASMTDGILKNPAPQVVFTEFNSKKLSFVLSVYVPNITSTSRVVNTLRFELYKRFAEEGILE